MSDMMKRFYAEYIQDRIEKQQKDDVESMWFDLLDNDLSPYQKEALQHALTFYAVQAFRLGLKTGMALEEDLRQ